MNIVFITHIFYPEMGAPAARVFETAKAWVDAGHKVTVVTCFPNHPTGVIPAQYKGLLSKEEEIEGIRVLRNFVYATPNEGFFARIIGHLSFMFSSVLLSVHKIKNPDVIIVTSPPYFSIFAAYFISFVKKVPFVFEVRDLWPESVVKLGVLKNKAIIGILEFFEMFYYRKAAKVVVVTKSFKDTLISRGINEDKIEVITNGADDRFIALPSNEEIEQLRDSYNLKNKFVVLYAGTHGMSHALEKIIDAADLLKGYEDITFLFVGEGAEKKNIIEHAQQLGIKNVQFLPGQPKELMPKIYGLADVCVVSLKNLELFDKVIPSKIFEIMACNKPIIASLKGESKELLLAANCSLVVELENSQEIAKAILILAKDKDYKNNLANNGRKFVLRHYTRQSLAQKYENLLKEIVRKKEVITTDQKN